MKGKKKTMTVSGKHKKEGRRGNRKLHRESSATEKKKKSTSKTFKKRDKIRDVGRMGVGYVTIVAK
jgi:hypothetical protein